MANWTDAILTEKGKALAAKVMAGQLDLQLTEIWFGDGTPGTDLGSKKIKAELMKKSQEGTDCVIRFRVRNTTVQTPIIMSELGFYAVDADGSTILFSYMTDDEPATLPRYSGGKEYRQTMTSAFGFSNAEQVTLNATILDGQTEEDVDAAIAAHDANVDAHNVLMTKHNSDEHAHEDIRLMFNNYLSLEESETQLSTHNTDSSAHTAILNAHNANVNSHNPITEMIAKILGETNWQENPVATLKDIKNLLGMGGIVGQRLEDNGYVKFANGLTIQWGETSNNISTAFGSKATLPIAFVTPLIAVGSLLNLGGAESEKNFDDKIILTSTQIAFKYFGHSYIAIGLS